MGGILVHTKYRYNGKLGGEDKNKFQNELNMVWKNLDQKNEPCLLIGSFLALENWQLNHNSL